MNVTTPSASGSESNTAATLLSLKRKSVRGSALNIVAQGFSVAISTAGTIILARLLDPEDYGMIAMVTAFIGFANLFREMGLSAAAIQKLDLTYNQQNALFWINIAAGTTLAGVAALCAPAVAWFYDRHELRDVMLVLSSSFIITSVGSQPGASLMRQMAYGRQAAAVASGLVSGLVVSIVLARNGCRYWSLALGSLAGTCVSTFLLFILSPFRPSRPKNISVALPLVRFGAHLTASDAINYFHRNLDNVLIGRFCGSESVGVYSRAYALLMFPIANLRIPINAVAFPALSSLQECPDLFRSYYRKASFIISALSIPITVFLFIKSTAIVTLLLGSRWLAVVPVFSWLAIAGLLQPVTGFSGSVLMSLGMGRRYLLCNGIQSVLCCLSFVIGVRWGAVGVAKSYALATCVVAPIFVYLAHRGTHVCFRDWLDAWLWPTISGVIAGLAVMALGLSEKAGLASVLVSLAVFAAGYAFVMILSPSCRRELCSLWRAVCDRAR